VKAKQSLKVLGNLHKLALKPGDVVVLIIKDEIGMETRVGLTESLARFFPKNKAMILDGGVNIGVISEHHPQQKGEAVSDTPISCKIGGGES